MVNRGQRIIRGAARSEIFVWALIAAVWIVLWIWQPSGIRAGDVLRFTQIAHGGTPYVDQQVEYPPLETVLIVVVGKTSVTGTALIVGAVNGGAMICCWLLLRAYWSLEAGRLFLWMALPLQVFMPLRLDIVPVALTLAGIVLSERRRPWAAGGAFAAAILFKVWPVVVLPLLLIRTRFRALVATISILTIGIVVWVGVSGIDAARQVESFRGASGWQIESVFGVIDRVVTSEPIRYEAGASRIGHIEGWETVVLRLATVGAIAIAWVLARRRPIDPAGGPALAAVASLLVLSPIASPQYVSWLLPWAAIVASERRGWDVRILAIGASVTASLVFAVYWGNQYALRELLVLAAVRAICIAGLAIIGFTHRTVDRARASAARASLDLQPANLPDG
jgi:hypothetical protein